MDEDLGLAARRRDLEREFDAKLRDLKAQVKRQLDHLEEDRRAWEEARRRQQKDLADRAERLRRLESNGQRAEAAQAVAADDVRRLRERVRELEDEKLRLKVAREGLERRSEALAARAKAASGALAGLTFVAVLGALSWLLLALQDGSSAVEAGVFLAVVLVMAAAALRVRARTR